MTKTGTRSAYIATIVMAVLLLPACGLKDDLYIPSEETQAPPAQALGTEEQNAEAVSPDDENGGEDPGQLSAPAP